MARSKQREAQTAQAGQTTAEAEVKAAVTAPTEAATEAALAEAEKASMISTEAAVERAHDRMRALLSNILSPIPWGIMTMSNSAYKQKEDINNVLLRDAKGSSTSVPPVFLANENYAYFRDNLVRKDFPKGSRGKKVFAAYSILKQMRRYAETYKETSEADKLRARIAREERRLADLKARLAASA